MKNYQILVICLYCLLLTQIAAAQYRAPTVAQVRKFSHDMVTDKKDSWQYAGGGDMAGGIAPPKFIVWTKLHIIDTIHHFLSFSNEGGMISGQIYNTREMELATTSFKPDNAFKYMYRVMEEDSIVLQPWTTPTDFRSNKFTSYAYLGKYDCRHKTIRLEIAEKGNLIKRAVYVYNSDDLPKAKITTMFKHYTHGLTAVSEQEWRKGFTVQSNDIEQIDLRVRNISRIEMYYVYLERKFDGKIMTWPIGNNWEHNFSSPDPEMHINSSYFDNPGKYTITIKPQIFDGDRKPIIIGSEVKAFFTVPRGPITFPIKTVMLIILIIFTTGGFMFMMYRDQQKRKLAKEAQNKQIATLQLQAVRSQLNPHFIFNALAGIQNLMNKNEVENANKYLSRFARLTRNILDDANKELTTIAHEITLLNDYLQMEQMRFGFQYSINVDEHAIDQQIEIPAMLLQPFAENAVKHGVSALKDKGLIKITIGKEDSNLVLTVQDNGRGFSTNEGTGMGLNLCEERIKLLNCIYKNTSITLNKKSDNSGTLISIELRNWV